MKFRLPGNWSLLLVKDSAIAPLPIDDPRHGTTDGYSNHKCRCSACREANAAAHRNYMNRHPEQREKARRRERRRRERMDG